MLIPETMRLEYGKNYGDKNAVWKMLSPDQFKETDLNSKGWQNHHRPITIFRQANQKIVFIDEKNINTEGKNVIDFDKGSWTSTDLGCNKRYSNKNFISFLFVVDANNTCTFRGVWRHEAHQDIEIEKQLYKDYQRTIYVNH